MQVAWTTKTKMKTAMKLIVNSYEDFTHSLSFEDNYKNVFRIRELCPRDFYWVAIEEQADGFSDLPMTFMVALIDRLLLSSPVSSIADIPLSRFRKIDTWVQREILAGNLMKVEDWLYYAYHLMGRQWGSNLDYLESVPMPKINHMVAIQSAENSKNQSPTTK